MKSDAKTDKISIAEIDDTMIQIKLPESDSIDILSLIEADFKMKYELQSFREISQDHYGKRGIGWHCVYLIYYKLE